jgi:hypothetical protein
MVLHRPVESTAVLGQVENGTFVLTHPEQIKPSPVLNTKLPEMMIQMLIHQYRPLIWR